MLGQGSGAKMGSIRRVLRGLRLEAGGKKTLRGQYTET